MRLFNLNPPPGRVLIGPMGNPGNAFQYFWFLARKTQATFPGFNGPEIFAPFTIVDGGGALPDTFISQYLLTTDPQDFSPVPDPVTGNLTFPLSITVSRPDLVQALQGTVPATPFLINPAQYPVVFEPPFVPTPPFFAWSMGVEIWSRDIVPVDVTISVRGYIFIYHVNAWTPMVSISVNPGSVNIPANNAPGSVVYVINPLSLPLTVFFTGQSGSKTAGPPTWNFTGNPAVIGGYDPTFVTDPLGPLPNIDLPYTNWHSSLVFGSVPVIPFNIAITDPLTGNVFTITFSP